MISRIKPLFQKHFSFYCIVCASVTVWRTRGIRRIVCSLLTALLCLSSIQAGGLGMEPIHLGHPHMVGWVPEGTPVLRGILYLDGWPMDHRWAEPCTIWKYAVLRTASYQYSENIEGNRTQKDAAYLAALEHGIRLLAERTGHPELMHVPIISSGFSRFSGSAQSIAELMPERCLGFMTGFGVSGREVDDKVLRDKHSWQETPSMWLGNEWENIYDGGSKTQLLERQWLRPPGVLRMASMTWQQYHNPYNFGDLGMIFIDQLIRERVPSEWDPGAGPAELKPVNIENGWLGSHTNWAILSSALYTTPNENAYIAPYVEFDGDKQNASWILNKPLAYAWRSFNSRHPQVQIIAPTHRSVQHVPPVLHSELGLRAGNPFDVKVLCFEDCIQQIEIFANDQKLGETQDFTGGETALGSTRQAEAVVTVTVPKRGVYGLSAKYITERGEKGWSRLAVLVIH